MNYNTLLDAKTTLEGSIVFRRIERHDATQAGKK
jgi:hypothetical protein